MSIEEYLHCVYVDFRREIENGYNLCNLKNLSFESGNLPEYEHVQTQRLYLLRYAYAYAFEYADMYERVLKQLDDPKKISVVSFGCGTMLDYWSLVYAIKEQREIPCRIDYRGIDKIQWHYQFISRRKDNMHFELENITNFFDDENALDSDVYFFPKSISEFSDGEMETILDGFKTKNIRKKVFYVCVSLRKKNETFDEKRTHDIIKAIKKNGYIARPEPQEYEEHGVKWYDLNFTYPTEALSYLQHLNEKCPQFICKGKNCHYDCVYLNRQPILKTNFLYNYIIRFERI